MAGFLSNLFTSPDGTQHPVDPNNPSAQPPQMGEASADTSSTIAQAKQDSSVVSSHVDPVKEQGKNALSHMDPRASQVLVHAYEETKRIKQTFIEPDQLFLALISDREIFKLLQEFKVDVAKLTREIQAKEKTGTTEAEPTLGEATKQILEESYLNAKKREVDYLSPEDILLTFFAKQTAVIEPLKKEGLEKSKIEEKLTKSTEFKTGKKSVLDTYGVDLTEKARNGQLDPVTGRDKEVERMVHILLRRTKNNPIIIGEAGVGKTALVEGLAEMMVAGKVTPDLAKKKIIQLDISNLIAGASHRGEFEERLQGVIKEVMASQNQIILFIDEIHTILGAGSTDGALDASNIVKPYLSRGQIQIIGATTTSEFRKNFEKDRAFERRFQPIVCDEPTEEVAIQMIKVLQPKYEKFHGVSLSEEAVKAAVHLSKKYIGERFLPDKAIDLLDEASAEVKLAHSAGGAISTTTPTSDTPASQDSSNGSDPHIQAEQSALSSDEQAAQAPAPGGPQSGAPVVMEEDIQKVVSRWTGVPVTKLTEKESEKLLKMEEIIHKNFINHERAVTAVSEAIRRGRIGLASANRPIASFIFLGPTGTGKTELAKVLAEIMFGKRDAMIRLDMSEYMEKHEVAKLTGAPPGYVGYEEGGQLTEAVRNKPYSIVLFDEIEKAHPDVFNILLQLLEDGRLTDNKGNTISFKNTIVICTSNIGSSLIQQKLAQASSEAANPDSAGQTQVPATGAGNVPAQEVSQQTEVPQPTYVNGQSGPVTSFVNAQGVPEPGPQLATGVTGSTGSSYSQPVSQTVAAPNVATPTNSISVPASDPNQTPEQAKRDKVFKELSAMVMGELTKHFRPELINRFDEVVVFEPLSQADMTEVTRLGIESTKKLLKEQNIDLQVSEAALAQLAKEGYDPMYGARPLRRLIQRSIENPIAIYLIQRSAQAGDTILIDYDSTNDKFTFNKAQSTAPVVASSAAAAVPELQTQSVDQPPPTPESPGQPATDPNAAVGATAPVAAQPAPGGALPEWLNQVTENAQQTPTPPEQPAEPQQDQPVPTPAPVS